MALKTQLRSALNQARASGQAGGISTEESQLIETLVTDLQHPQTLAQWRADPYWPKWDHAWWKLTLLYELDGIQYLPWEVLEAFGTILDQHYLHHFPLHESELPPGCDPYRQIICHCALGTAWQILASGGVDVEKQYPWMHAWLFRYLLPDGGYNCDEQAYTGSQKSSLVSTLPMLEALLISKNTYTPQEASLLKAGVDYLLNHQLFKSSSGQLIDPHWLKPIFPRFYSYDILRGLRFLTYWQLKTKEHLPEAPLQAALAQLFEQFESGIILPQNWYLAQEGSWVLQDNDWIFQKTSTQFQALLDSQEVASRILTREWVSILRILLGPYATA